MQEKRIDDYWNVDENKSLSDSWTGFTKFIQLKEKTPKGYMRSGKRSKKVQTTTRQGHVWPDVWTKIANPINKEKKTRNGRTRGQDSAMLVD